MVPDTTKDTNSVAAKALARKLPKKINPILDNDLLEVDLAPWNGLTIDEVKSQFPNEYLISIELSP